MRNLPEKHKGKYATMIPLNINDKMITPQGHVVILLLLFSLYITNFNDWGNENNMRHIDTTLVRSSF